MPGSDPSQAPGSELDGSYHDDGASYVDAATVALRFSSVELGPASPEAGPTTVAPVTPRRLRDTMGHLVTGVCVVTAIADGEDVAMTANSVTSLSLDPPLVLVCIARSARFHDLLVSTDAWGISILDERAAEVSSHFTRSGRPREGELSSRVCKLS